jgi:hypothetical protein
MSVIPWGHGVTGADARGAQAERTNRKIPLLRVREE